MLYHNGILAPEVWLGSQAEEWQETDDFTLAIKATEDDIVDMLWDAGLVVMQGETVIYKDTEYEVIQTHMTQINWTPDIVPALYAVKQIEPEPGTTPMWIAGERVDAGDRRIYHWEQYECLQSHTTQTGWEPPNVLALWKLI